MNFNIFKKENKLKKVAYCLGQYVENFKSRNCFYYSALEELNTLKEALNGIEAGSIALTDEQWAYIREICRAKKVKFGKYECVFN